MTDGGTIFKLYHKKLVDRMITMIDDGCLEKGEESKEKGEESKEENQIYPICQVESANTILYFVVSIDLLILYIVILFLLLHFISIPNYDYVIVGDNRYNGIIYEILKFINEIKREQIDSQSRELSCLSLRSCITYERTIKFYGRPIPIYGDDKKELKDIIQMFIQSNSQYIETQNLKLIGYFKDLFGIKLSIEFITDTLQKFLDYERTKSDKDSVDDFRVSASIIPQTVTYHQICPGLINVSSNGNNFLTHKVILTSDDDINMMKDHLTCSLPDENFHLLIGDNIEATNVRRIFNNIDGVRLGILSERSDLISEDIFYLNNFHLNHECIPEITILLYLFMLEIFGTKRRDIPT